MEIMIDTQLDLVIKYKFICDKCKYHTNIKSSYDKHLKSTLHATGKRKIRKDRKQEIYLCQNCNFQTNHEHNFNTHYLNNHATTDEKKTKFIYYCNKCNFGTFVKNAYDKHESTKKHKIKTNIY